MRNPPNILDVLKIVNPEQVTVFRPCGTEADMLMITFPLRTNDEEALPSENEETPQLPVLPMNGM